MAFVFAAATAAKVANTVAVPESTGRRYWAPRRYDSYHRGITARDHRQAVQADAEDERRRAAGREARRSVRERCGAKFTDERGEETTAHGGAWKAGDLSACGPCHANDVARQEAARRQAAAPPEPDDDRDQEPMGVKPRYR
ncbi:hypothetical protein ACH4F6_30380 [Streptomyces sp. NPDC017936]|uniref:hypothetical protein n=1 Tax=Streptomyces sp. NPDC017936 TaxID=3365016 RepID=UPI0037A95BFD